MYDVFTFYLQRGNVDVGFLGGAQIDRFGNINATVIGDYDHPKVRLPGSGGSMEIAAWANRCYIMTPHQKRRFPEKVDFQTSAGFCYGGQPAQEAGVRGGGPQAVVTNLGILEPDGEGELILTALHPGVTVEEAQANTGWALQGRRAPAPHRAAHRGRAAHPARRAGPKQNLSVLIRKIVLPWRKNAIRPLKSW